MTFTDLPRVYETEDACWNEAEFDPWHPAILFSQDFLGLVIWEKSPVWHHEVLGLGDRFYEWRLIYDGPQGRFIWHIGQESLHVDDCFYRVGRWPD